MNSMHSELNLAINATEVDQYFYSSTLPLRYCARGMHAVAYEIVEFAQTDATPIVTDWCCCVMKEIEDDNDAFKIISSRKSSSFDATAIAIAASNLKRPNLALMLSQLETYPAKLVSYFMSTKSFEAALSSAIRSMDSKLFISVVAEIIKENESNVDGFLIPFFLRNPSSCFMITSLEKLGRNDSVIDAFKKTPLNDTTIELKLRYMIRALSEVSVIEPIEQARSDVKEIGKLSPKNPILKKAGLHFKKGKNIMNGIESFVETVGKDSVNMPINKVIEKLVLSGEIDSALELGKKAEMKDKICQVIIARTVISNQRTELYSSIAKKCPVARPIAIAMLIASGCQKDVANFISYVPEKEQASLNEKVNDGSFQTSNIGSSSISSEILLDTPVIGME
jgi:hypothetical protein